MKTSGILKAVCAAGLAASCVWALAGCASGTSSTGGVAATVNGEEIGEDKVTSSIESSRTSMNLTEVDAWGQWLVDNDMTPETIREDVINSLSEQILIVHGAKEKGISVESSEIDEVVNPMRERYENDEKWQQALTSAGFEDEAAYRKRIEESLLQTKLVESFATTEEPTQEELVKYAQMYATSYTGAKRSSHILFDAADEATAQTVLDQINKGEIDFAEAAKQYSKDSSADQGGDVGWDKINTWYTEYQTALDGLEKDQVSGLVTSQAGFHIIKCTDVFTAPEEVTSTDQLPAEFMQSITDELKQQKQTEAAQAWFTEYKEGAAVEIKPMPEGLPYAVDTSKYTKAETGENATDGGGEGTGEASDPAEEPSTDNAAANNEQPPAAEGENAGESTDTAQQPPATS